MAIQDLRRRMPGGQSKRNINQIKKIARHHSGTTAGDAIIFARHHTSPKPRGLGWKTSGYHEVILPNGDVQLCYDASVITNGVGGQNSHTYHICVVGNGKFTAAQERTFNERAEIAMQLFNLNASDVLGHNEFPGHRSNACPGIDMNQVRRNITTYINSKKTAVAPSGNGTYTVKAGDTIGRIAAAHNTTVDAIARLNNIANPNVIIAGQRLNIPGAAFVTYTVRAGDVLSIIARNHNTSVDAIMRINNIANANLIRVGQQIRIPRG